MIQEVAPHQFSNEYHPQAPDANSYVLCYQGKEILLSQGADGKKFPTFGEVAKVNQKIYDNYRYLFTMDNDRYYLVNEIDCPSANLVPEKIEVLRDELPLHEAFVAVTGGQLYRWYRDHKFCGRCGEEMKDDDKERMLYCESCQNVEYPKIMPAVIVGVINGNRILMSKYANYNQKNYALLAGFVEVGETLGAAIRREIMEEVGLKVKNIRYYRSQPWGFSDSLLMGFFVDLDGDDTVTLDKNELALAEWFEREDIPVKEHNISLTNEMIMHFKKGLI